MGANGQEIVVLASVLAALGYLGHRAWQLVAARPKGGCLSGSCGSCPSGKLAIQDLVAIGPARTAEAARVGPESRTPGGESPGRSRS